MDPNTPHLQLPQWGSTDDFEYTQVNAALMAIDTKLAPSSYSTANRPVGTDRFNGLVIYDTDVAQFMIWDSALATWLPFGGVKPWTSFTPVLYSDAGGAAPVAPGSGQAGKYMIIGKTCFAQASGTFTGATSSGAGISLPFTAKDRILNCGTLAVQGGSFPADQSGIAYMTSAKDKLICVAYTNGFRDAAAANTIRYNVMYELP